MKEVTLLSLGPSREHCPFETDELWGISTCLLEDDLQDKKFTKVFCVDGTFQSINDHPPIEVKSISRAIERASELNIPMVSIHSYATEPYPLKEIVAKFKSSYLGPTISYMIAYALYYDYKKLHIYGIDQGPQLYYQLGKPKITFWLGYASALGVELVMGKGSLRWTYSAGIESVPIAWAREEYEKLYREVTA